jgi:hypothetical protein
MSGWVECALVIVLCVADLVVLQCIRRVVRRRTTATRRLCEHRLAELDRLPEFDLSPADWPLRESPPRQLERQR